MGSAMGRPGNVTRLFSRKRKAPPQSLARNTPPQKLADPTIHEADNPLLTRLRDVHVTSSSTTLTSNNQFASERMKKPDNLPQDRSFYTDDVFVIDKSSVGFLTYQEVVEILNERETKGKDVWTPDIVAEKFKINPSDAANLMKYFSSYRQPVSKQSPP